MEKILFLCNKYHDLFVSKIQIVYIIKKINIHSKIIISYSPMYENFTLLILSQHYPVSQQFQIFTCKDVSIDTDVADYLQSAEQQISQHVVDRINACALMAVQRST